ncbi:hypothetical protein OG402_33870 [Streptomyces anulatus]|uniref:hypothetical protein n=1 Tax=Streptomyces anulatus TaxID=1892 RepID=UPI002253637B|nr:hypothetical protein [Streptomyces anulatus]MCX4605457.1 hypothetical protein [Streptomyces anulatus]
MPANLDIPDVHVLLAAEGTLHLDSPQSEVDVAAAVGQALEAVTQAYRVAYAHAGGDDEDDTVDGLDMAFNLLRSIADDLK